MPDIRSESGRKTLLATLLDYPGSFALECAKCPNPKCGSREARMVNIRQVGEVARRRRECEKCGTRFTTWERIAPGKAARIVSKG